MAMRAGNGRGGTGHFWWQRMTAVLLVPLALWFLALLIIHAGAPHATVAEFLSRPVNAGALVLLILTGLFHGMLGIQTVIEDYVHGAGTKLALLALNTLFHVAVAVACLGAALALALS